MALIKGDGYVAAGGTGRTGPQTAKLYCTEAVTAGDWIASYATDTSSPSGLAGGPQGSFRKAISTNADAVYNTVGVAVETTSAAGEVLVNISGYSSLMKIVSASVAAGDDLITSSTSAAATVVGTPTANVRVVGSCITDNADNTGTGMVNLHPMFAGIV